MQFGGYGVSNSPAEKTKSLIENINTASNRALGLDKVTELAGKGTKFEITFEYLGFLFAVKASTHQQQTNMRIHAHLGNIPYTVEGGDRRTNAMKALESAAGFLGGRITITSQQRIMLLEDYVIDEPLTPVLMISKATILLVRAKPYLELLASVVRPPLAPRPVLEA